MEILVSETLGNGKPLVFTSPFSQVREDLAISGVALAAICRLVLFRFNIALQ